MENFILYLGKTSVLLAIFFLAYHFLLRKETFFNSNRWFLLLGIATSLALPLVIFKKIIWIEPAFHETLSPATAISNQFSSQFSPAEAPDFEINWPYAIAAIYVAGTLFFLIKFIRDFWSLKKIFKNQPVKISGNFKFIDTDSIQSPFSFFNYIFFNSNSFQQEELDNILEHEKVHSSQFHSADMIIGQIFCIAFWFNPFAWLHKKAITQNLEFIADSTALKVVSDRIVYQKTLLKVSAPHHCIPITNHFFQSLIKKRIVMLNKNQSKKRNSWKYAIILPVLTVFMLQFQVKTVAQEKAAVHSMQEKPIEVTVDKNSTDDYLEAQAEILKKQYGIKLKFSNIRRNSDKEITAIKTSVKSKEGISTTAFQKGSEPIQPFEVRKEEEKIVIATVSSNGNTVSRNGKTMQLANGVSGLELPVPPTPPTPPAMPNMASLPAAPAAPAMPNPPAAPSVAYDENSEAWKKFEEQMKQFEIQMKSKEGEFAKFEKEMEKFEEQMEHAFSPEFEKQMAEFEKKMDAFEVQMEAYQEKLEEKASK